MDGVVKRGLLGRAWRAVDAYVDRHPRWALAGFFPLFWPFGTLYRLLQGFIAFCEGPKDGFFGLFYMMWGLGAMLFSPVWPIQVMFERQAAQQRKDEQRDGM